MSTATTTAAPDLPAWPARRVHVDPVRRILIIDAVFALGVVEAQCASLGSAGR